MLEKLFVDNTEKTILLKAKCEELSAEVERLTKEKETAFEEIEQLKDQVKSYILYKYKVYFHNILQSIKYIFITYLILKNKLVFMLFTSWSFLRHLFITLFFFLTVIQILSQSTYCTSLGAVLGNLTWRASKFPQIVDTWISNVSMYRRN